MTVMITIQKTVDIPSDRRLHLDLELPEIVPSGRTSVVLVFPVPESPAAQTTVSTHDPQRSFSLEELKKEARQKTAQRLANPEMDSMKKYAGCLKGSKVFDGDSVAIQKAMRDEWPEY
ncbi:MAG: hypothetical protein LBK13_10895 [Spirochaetales bacterium]|jgi:hypothetical protein|nr:hypothetical protein [Spirochaetales bacterium]